MFFKVSALHVYSHQDSTKNQIENCKICDSAIENQNAKHLSTALAWLEKPFIHKFNVIPFFSHKQKFTTPKLHFRLFGRPPPALL